MSPFSRYVRTQAVMKRRMIAQIIESYYHENLIVTVSTVVTDSSSQVGMAPAHLEVLQDMVSEVGK